MSRKASDKRQTRAEKVGRWKYLWRRLDRIDRRLSRVDARQRTIFHGLRELMVFKKDYLSEVVCRNGLDEEIIQVLREGDALPSVISNTLKTRGFRRVNRFKVTRRIQGMNKRLMRELGQKVAEKRGKDWSLRDIILEVWGGTVEEVREDIIKADTEKEKNGA